MTTPLLYKNYYFCAQNSLLMKNNNYDIINEITPKSETGCIYTVAREKKRFDFPVHTHNEYEINLLIGCKGALRIVGDSIVELDDFDLVFIGPGLEHGWLQNNCTNEHIKEITIQFPNNYFVFDFLKSNNLHQMYDLVLRSANGISFSNESILENYAALKALTVPCDSFEKMARLSILVQSLAKSSDYSILSSNSFIGQNPKSGSRRISKVQNYINEHYMSSIGLNDLAEITNMTPSAFARFFKQHTGRTVSEYILEIRLGVAVRQLVDTQKSISEICYESGFNNLSHFSRCFHKSKGYTPSEFRQLYAQQSK